MIHIGAFFCLKINESNIYLSNKILIDNNLVNEKNSGQK